MGSYVCSFQSIFVALRLSSQSVVEPSSNDELSTCYHSSQVHKLALPTVFSLPISKATIPGEQVVVGDEVFLEHIDI